MNHKTTLLLLCSTLLAGCGQTGDLYLPEAGTGAPAQSVPATNTDEDDDDEKTPAG